MFFSLTRSANHCKINYCVWALCLGCKDDLIEYLQKTQSKHWASLKQYIHHYSILSPVFLQQSYWKVEFSSWCWVHINNQWPAASLHSFHKCKRIWLSSSLLNHNSKRSTVQKIRAFQGYWRVRLVLDLLNLPTLNACLQTKSHLPLLLLLRQPHYQGTEGQPNLLHFFFITHYRR